MNLRRPSIVTLVTSIALVPLVLGGFATSAAGQTATPAFSGYATGTGVHAHLLQAGPDDPTTVRVVDSEVAFSGAGVNSQTLDGLPILNETGTIVVPAETTADGETVDLSPKFTYGRGYGLDVSLGGEAQAEPQLRLAGLAEAWAPGNTGPNESSIAVPGDPLAYAEVAEGQAFAQWEEPPCILGSDLARGLGSVADAELLDQAGSDPEEGGQPDLEQAVVSTNADPNQRDVTWTMSHNFLIDGAGDNFGLASQARATIAPVTLFEGTEDETTIEFLGEFILTAYVTGDGSSRLVYGPSAEASPQTPILRILTRNPDTGEMTEELLVTTQQFFEAEGLIVDASPLLTIAVGEDPRAIGGEPDSEPMVSPTHVSGAIDVVRIEILTDEGEGGTGEGAEVRLGHLEVSATVPEGGIDLPCEIPVTKTVEPEQVNVGQSFQYTITVENTFDCTLTDVRVVDTISVVEGSPEWEVTATDPQADSVTEQEIVWEDVGPIAPGESVTLTVSLLATGGPGVIADEATATAVCQGLPAEGLTGVAIPVTGVGRVTGPEVALVDQPVGEQVGGGQAPLPVTGASAAAVAGIALLGSGFALRRWFGRPPR